MDGQKDVGHINLIGGLVTRNPPNKKINCLPSCFLWSVHTCSSHFICFILLEDSTRGDSKLLLDHIFVNYCWKPISIYSCVQLPAFDILFVFHCEKTSTVSDSKILLETHCGLRFPTLCECTYTST